MDILLFLGGIGWGEIIVIALIVLLFFGGKKIPEMMKGLGRGVRSFKDGMNGKEEEQETEKKDKEYWFSHITLSLDREQQGVYILG